MINLFEFYGIVLPTTFGYLILRKIKPDSSTWRIPMSKLITATNASVLFAVSFIFAGVLGFVPNPLVAPDGLFAVNAMHNMVHLVTGAAFLVGAFMFGRPRLTLLAIGALYVVVTVAGFLTEGNMLLGLVHINEADRWLHAGLAAAILGAGLAVGEDDLRTPAERSAA